MSASYWKNKAYRLAEELGATIVVNRVDDIEAEAPDGRCWGSDPWVHVLVASRWDDEPLSEVWKDLAQRMEHGVIECDCQACRERKESPAPSQSPAE